MKKFRRHWVRAELIFGNSIEQNLNISKIWTINIEQRFETVLPSVIKKIKIKASRCKMQKKKTPKINHTQKTKNNIKILGVSEVFKEITEKLFTELKTKLNLQIQRASRKIRSIKLNKMYFS